MGGNYFITRAAEAKYSNHEKKLDYKAICSRLRRDPELDGKICGVYDIGCLLYRLSRSSSFRFGTSQFYIDVVKRLFTGTIMPILYSFPEMELVLCLDGCSNDLKEHFKEIRLPEEEYYQRQVIRPTVYASNCIFTRLISKIGRALLEQHQVRRLSDPTLPDLKDATVMALIGPQEADDVATEVVDTFLGQSDVKMVFLFYIDNDNVASGASGFSSAFKQQQSGTALVCVNNPIVGADKKLEGLYFNLLQVCEEDLEVHPQLLPVLAAVIKHDKSPGWDSIAEGKIHSVVQRAQSFLYTEPGFLGKVESGWTMKLVEVLLQSLVDKGALPPCESAELTKERISAVAAGAVDSVLGYPDFFTSKNKELLHRSQKGECFLRKVSPGPDAAETAVVFEEIVDTNTYVYQALGNLDIAALMSDSVSLEIAMRCLDIGIATSAREEHAPHVAAMCLVSSSSSNWGFYIGRNARLSKQLNVIGAGVVRRLKGFEYVDGMLEPVMFLIRVASGGGYGITVEPRSGTSTAALAVPGLLAPSDVPNAQNLPTLTDSPGIDTFLASFDTPTPAIVSISDDAHTPKSTASSDLDGVNMDSDSTEDANDIADLFFAVPEDEGEDAFEEVTAATANTNAGSTTKLSATQFVDLAEKPKVALVILDVNDEKSLVLWSEDRSLPPSADVNNGNADTILLAVIEDAYVALTSRCGAQISAASPHSLARSNISRRSDNGSPYMVFGEYSILAKALRQLKCLEANLFDGNSCPLAIFVGGGKPILFRFAVPNKIGVYKQAQVKATCDYDDFPADARCIEFGINEGSCLVARFLTDNEAGAPPWKNSFLEFRAATSDEHVAALSKSASIAKDQIKYAFGNDLHEGYFRDPQTNRTEAFLALSKQNSPFRRAISKAHADGMCDGQRPVPFAILLLASNEVILGKIKYDPSLPEADLNIKVNKDALVAGGISVGAVEQRVRLGVGKSQRHGNLIAVFNQSEEEQDGSISHLDTYGIDAKAEIALINSLVVGEEMEREREHALMGGSGSLGQFKFDAKSRGSLAKVALWGPIVTSLLHATRERFQPEKLDVLVKFLRPDNPAIDKTVLKFAFEKGGGMVQTKVVFKKGYRGGENLENVPDFRNVTVQVGIVAGSRPMKLGLQFLTGKRDAVGADEGTVPIAWEQCHLTFMDVLMLVKEAMVNPPNDAEWESAISSLRDGGHLEEDEMDQD